MGSRKMWCRTGGQSLPPASGKPSAPSWAPLSAPHPGTTLSLTARQNAWIRNWRPAFAAWFRRTQLCGANISSGLSMPTTRYPVLLLVYPLFSAPMVISHHCSPPWRRRLASRKPRLSFNIAAGSGPGPVKFYFGVRPGLREQQIAGEARLPPTGRDRWCGFLPRTFPWG